MLPCLQETMQQYGSERTPKTHWRQPLLGYAAASDPLFEEVRRRVGPTYELPESLLPGARTVIAYFIPFTEEITAQVPAAGSEISPDAWAFGYIETNELLERIGCSVVANLVKQGFRAIALPPTHHFDKKLLVSDWSHKHAAYIAGIGTWGLHQMLITQSGCCGRFGTVVTDAVIEPTPRPQEEYCLSKRNGSCFACTARCVSGALSQDRFDRQRCYEVCLRNEDHHRAKGQADVCGRCAIRVPCSFAVPMQGK